MASNSKAPRPGQAAPCNLAPRGRLLSMLSSQASLCARCNLESAHDRCHPGAVAPLHVAFDAPPPRKSTRQAWRRPEVLESSTGPSGWPAVML